MSDYLSTHLQQQLGPKVKLPSTLVFDHPTAREIALLLAERGGGVPLHVIGGPLSLGDPAAAIRLSGCLLLFVFFLILLERVQRGRARFDGGTARYRPIVRFDLRGWWRWATAIACGLPVVFGFILPVLQLLMWGFQVAPEAANRQFLLLTLNSFGLAIAAAIITVRPSARN